MAINAILFIPFHPLHPVKVFPSVVRTLKDAQPYSAVRSEFFNGPIRGKDHPNLNQLSVDARTADSLCSLTVAPSFATKRAVEKKEPQSPCQGLWL